MRNWRRTVLVMLGASAMVGSACVEQDGLAVADENRPSEVSKASSSPAALVQQALAAELSGQKARRAALLDEAMTVDRNFAPARWHAGQVQSAKGWLDLQGIAEQASRDRRLQQYRNQRSRLEQRPDGALLLARWCRKAGLEAQARAHWVQVLGQSPGHREALAALGLKLHQGWIVTEKQLEAEANSRAQQKQDIEQWRESVAQWKIAMARGSADQQEAVVAEIQQIQDPSAVAALVNLLREIATDSTTKHDSPAMVRLQAATVQTLGRLGGETAHDALLWYAVMSPTAEVRRAATGQLRPLPLVETVPRLLAGLTMPIEASVSVAQNGLGDIDSHFAFYREGPAGYDQQASWHSTHPVERAVVSMADSYVIPGRTEHVEGFWKETCYGPAYVEAYDRVIPDRTVTEQYSQTAAGNHPESIARQQATLVGVQLQKQQVASQIAQANQRTESLNLRLRDVLVALAEHDAGAVPRDWWRWWQQYIDERPEVQAAAFAAQRKIGMVLAEQAPSGFARGTLVQTQLGPQRIEQLRIGDLVLAQHPQTGELALKPIVAGTVRSASATRRLESAATSVTAATGQFVWQTGRGWRMFRDLESEDRTLGLGGSSQVDSAADSIPLVVFDLAVADFGTYFVGPNLTLARGLGNTLPISSSLPGLAE